MVFPRRIDPAIPHRKSQSISAPDFADECCPDTRRRFTLNQRVETREIYCTLVNPARVFWTLEREAAVAEIFRWRQALFFEKAHHQVQTVFCQTHLLIDHLQNSTKRSSWHGQEPLERPELEGQLRCLRSIENWKSYHDLITRLKD